VHRLFLAACFILAFSSISAAQSYPRWEIYGGYGGYFAGSETEGGPYYTHGVQTSAGHAFTSYFRLVGEFNAEFADHVVDLAPLPPGAKHVNSKELLGLFGPEAVYRGFRRFDIFGHYLIGVSYGRDNEAPKIPTVSYTTWAYAIGFGVDWKIKRRVAVRLFEGDWVTTHYPMVNTEAQDNWRLSEGVVFRLGR